MQSNRGLGGNPDAVFQIKPENALVQRTHDRLIASIRTAQARAIEVEAMANIRLAEEYDAAQARGEVATGREGRGLGVPDGNAQTATAADLGLRRKEIHDARRLRDAEGLKSANPSAI